MGAAWAEERGSAAELQHLSHFCCSEIHPALSLQGAVPPWPLPFLPGRSRGTWSQHRGLRAECLRARSHPPTPPILCAWGFQLEAQAGLAVVAGKELWASMEFVVTVVPLRALG